MYKELVSIIILSYKNLEYIEETIDSILIQSYKNIELIIGDDTIALACHDCKKVYGFSDVNYKDEKYREIYLNCSKGCD